MKVYLINYCIDLITLPLFISGVALLIGLGQPYTNLGPERREGREASRREGRGGALRATPSRDVFVVEEITHLYLRGRKRRSWRRGKRSKEE